MSVKLQESRGSQKWYLLRKPAVPKEHKDEPGQRIAGFAGHQPRETSEGSSGFRERIFGWKLYIWPKE